ncbi:hypothetical protein TNCV_2270641 [Trichonephila clavipes]|nr:hypothetical protein TNCV_2270641 [Trichonephila clavipes]
MATVMIGHDTTPDVSADVVGSKADVLKAAVSVTPPQPSTVKWWKVPQWVVKKLSMLKSGQLYCGGSLGLSNNHLIFPRICAAWLSGDLISSISSIAASTFAQLCLYISGDDLLLGVTTQLHAFQ